MPPLEGKVLKMTSRSFESHHCLYLYYGDFFKSIYPFWFKWRISPNGCIHSHVALIPCETPIQRYSSTPTTIGDICPLQLTFSNNPALKILSAKPQCPQSPSFATILKHAYTFTCRRSLDSFTHTLVLALQTPPAPPPSLAFEVQRRD